MAQQKTALIIATSYGVEADEITKPKEYLEGLGVSVTVATPSNEPVQTLVGDKDLGPIISSDVKLSNVEDDGFDILVVPGGTINADSLRLVSEAAPLVADFARAGTPIAAICHAPWIVIDAGIAVGKTLTSYPSLRTDVSNAGGNWVDEAVVVDDTNGFVLITSRTPEDMDQFTAAIGRQLA